MTAISEYKTQIEEVRKRLNGANGHHGDRIGELKERLSAVRSSLLRKQEIIDAQTQEIADLRDENGQLSDMLDQALAALDEQSKGGLQEIVQSFDSEFSGLLSDEGAEAVAVAAVAAEAVAAEAGNPEPEAEAKAGDAGPDNGGDRRDPPSKGAGAGKPRSDDADPEPEIENESPALRRIMGRRRR
jgi:chromosome segregation ATPase